ncbi:hypothetical protein [Cellulomonas pakistanensis]|uniref:PRC-barrel domain-containing protein n=1 Tax=Cellulomonas pakistanensis TaxID=992287 RepID=A0A919U2P5_9CELL|nr:hypothetical protein [Cellulomonas pakistanensis]GIG36308.1 hypothetical protein Cpa01nite_16890 [Cellulomonas pakistanensis]
MSIPTSDQGPIASAQEGMRVVDASGDEVGTVREVSFGDPGAVTSEGQRTGGTGGFLADAARSLVGPDDLSPSDQERLARLGYVRIDAKGLFKSDRFAAGDQVAAVEGDVVQLSVAKEQLVG